MSLYASFRDLEDTTATDPVAGVFLHGWVDEFDFQRLKAYEALLPVLEVLLRPGETPAEAWANARAAVEAAKAPRPSHTLSAATDEWTPLDQVVKDMIMSDPVTFSDRAMCLMYVFYLPFGAHWLNDGSLHIKDWNAGVGTERSPLKSQKLIELEADFKKGHVDLYTRQPVVIDAAHYLVLKTHLTSGQLNHCAGWSIPDNADPAFSWGIVELIKGLEAYCLALQEPKDPLLHVMKSVLDRPAFAHYRAVAESA